MCMLNPGFIFKRCFASVAASLLVSAVFPLLNRLLILFRVSIKLWADKLEQKRESVVERHKLAR